MKITSLPAKKTKKIKMNREKRQTGDQCNRTEGYENRFLLCPHGRAHRKCHTLQTAATSKFNFKHI